MDVTRQYRNPRNFATNSLRYFVKGGAHVIAHYMGAGEQEYPTVYRFETIEAARVMWLKLLTTLHDRGYTERVM